VAFNPSAISKVLVRVPNWLGDAVISLAAVRALRSVLPHAEIAVAVRPYLADFYARESAIDRVIPYTARTLTAKREFARSLRPHHFDLAVLLQNAFDAALLAWMANIPERIGYRRDARGLLLTHAIPVPEPGDIPRHERFYYLELLRRAGMIEHLPPSEEIRLDHVDAARESGLAHIAALGAPTPVIGVSPGAAYGGAKRWFPERFAEAAIALSPVARSVLVFGSASDRVACDHVAAALARSPLTVRNLVGQTTLVEFINLASACRLFLTNDSGSMHVAAALGVPTVAVFGPTDDTTTGPVSHIAQVVREHAECSPCLLRECPIDHRCMTRVTANRVSTSALQLWEESAPAWTQELKF
jgi:heptosyltransferase-2